ncbi:hypothetical protein GCM10027435_29760 [Haloparvum alkalitolerans]|uniref:hypothetical protein n=1 Tax=Haloparvum alkalitolerans TaxID=1042953 RepID=UPI003CECE9FE
MLPLQLDAAVGLAVAALLLLVPGAFAAVPTAVFLLSSRIRALFAAVPPTDSPYPAYVLLTVGLGVPWSVGVLAALNAPVTGPASTANAMLDAVVGLGIGYLLGLPIAATAGLPRLGIDWNETGYGPRTWASVAGATTLYTLTLAVPFFLLSLVFALPTGSPP